MEKFEQVSLDSELQRYLYEKARNRYFSKCEKAGLSGAIPAESRTEFFKSKFFYKVVLNNNSDWIYTGKYSIDRSDFFCLLEYNKRMSR